MALFIPLDVDYPSDEEFIDAGPMAELLYIRGLCFMKRKLTDGNVTKSQLATAAVGIPNPRRQAARLVEVGLWEITDRGWYCPAYLKRNPSKAEVHASQELSKEAGVRGNHERWHIGPDGRASSKCPLCVQDRIAPPDRPPDRVEDRVSSPVPETETETETEPVPKPETETEEKESSSVFTVVRGGRRDDDDLSRTLALIVDAKVADRRPGNVNGYRQATKTNTLAEDGELIRRLLADGDPPEVVASFVLGHGTVTESERTSVPWCAADCPTCGGDDGNRGWVWVEDGVGGLAPCPERKALA